MRTLQASWTCETFSGVTEYGQELIDNDKAAKMIQEEIDWGVLSAILISSGWTAVDAVITTRSNDPDIVDKWFAENIKGSHRSYNGHWLFENAGDAAWFILRWK